MLGEAAPALSTTPVAFESQVGSCLISNQVLGVCDHDETTPAWSLFGAGAWGNLHGETLGEV